MYPYILSCDTFNVHYTVSLEFIRVTELSGVGEYSHNRHGINYLFDIYANVIRENINFLKIIRTRLFKRITVLIVRMKILLSSLCINFKFRIM